MGRYEGLSLETTMKNSEGENYTKRVFILCIPTVTCILKLHKNNFSNIAFKVSSSNNDYVSQCDFQYLNPIKQHRFTLFRYKIINNLIDVPDLVLVKPMGAPFKNP